MAYFCLTNFKNHTPTLRYLDNEEELYDQLFIIVQNPKKVRTIINSINPKEKDYTWRIKLDKDNWFSLIVLS